MAIVYDAPVTPDDLTAFIREAPTPADFALSAAFPVRTENDNTIDFGAEVVRRNRTAKFRSFDGRIHVSERDISSGKRVKLPPLSSSLTSGEYERLQVQFARTGGTNTSALVNAIYDDAEQLIREIRARMELAWGDVFADGKLTINENGFAPDEADYGVPASNKVTAATAWTDVAAPALTNLISWNNTYISVKGTRAGATRTSNRTIQLLLRNTEIINAVYGAAAGRTMVTLIDLNSLLVSLGIAPLVPSYDTKVDVDGADVLVVPEDKLLFTPANLGDLGYTCFGVSATALELVNSTQSDLAFADAPGVVGVVDKSGPPYREQTLVDAVGMPILTDAKGLFIADVF
jgi:hypothetical protein